MRMLLIALVVTLASAPALAADENSTFQRLAQKQDVKDLARRYIRKPERIGRLSDGSRLRLVQVVLDHQAADATADLLDSLSRGGTSDDDWLADVALAAVIRAGGALELSPSLQARLRRSRAGHAAVALGRRMLPEVPAPLRPIRQARERVLVAFWMAPAAAGERDEALKELVTATMAGFRARRWTPDVAPPDLRIKPSSELGLAALLAAAPLANDPNRLLSLLDVERYRGTR